MLLTARNAKKNVRFKSSPKVFSSRELKNITTTGEIIELAEIRKAADRIAPYIKRTPLFYDEDLSARFDSNFYLKHELLQTTGAFKVRGAFNKILSLTEAENEREIVAVSGGNHAQAVAYAAHELGRKALILMPEFTPRNYIEKTENYGARVELYPTMAQAFDRAKQYEAGGAVYVHPFDNETVVAGQGTIGLEILADAPQVTDVIVSIGGGGLAGGVAAAIKWQKPNVKIWGVETNGAASMRAALDANEIVTLPKITSIARTLGAPAVSQLTFDLARRYLSDVTVVDDAEAVREMFYLLDKTKVLTEPATSCTLAAAEKLRGKFDETSHVVVILCGGNIGLDDLFQLKKIKEN